MLFGTSEMAIFKSSRPYDAGIFKPNPNVSISHYQDQILARRVKLQTFDAFKEHQSLSLSEKLAQRFSNQQKKVAFWIWLANQKIKTIKLITSLIFDTMCGSKSLALWRGPMAFWSSLLGLIIRL